MTTKLKITRKYYLLLIDIKRSTSLSTAKRQRIFADIESQLKKLNRTLKPTPLIKLSVSYGDEIAGLFDSPKQFYRIIFHLQEKLFPEAEFRFAAVYGKLGIVSNDIRKIGGPIFKQADELIKQLKKQDRFCSWALGDSLQNDVLNSLTEMSNQLLQRMTSYQRTVWKLLEQGLSQKEISKRLKKYPQSISTAVKRGGADQVLRAGQTINRILEKLK